MNLLLTLLVMSFTSFGQDDQTLRTDVSNQNQTKVEKLEVTGSRIKRIDVEGPSPVLTLDREYLDRSGYNSVADVLRDSTVSSFGVEREFSDESNSVGAATVGLRGFGSDKTLVLLDGRRLPKIDGSNSVDLNLIPFAAIERVEILKDGASAIYGSDALAGVINFITKKNYDGSNVQFRYSQPEQKGGVRQDVSATYGKVFSKGSVLAIYQYRNNQRIMDQDRDWSKGGLSTYNSPANRRVSNDTGLWQSSDPNCDGSKLLQLSDGSSFCRFDYSVYTSSLPDTEQHSAMLRGDYELTSDINAFAMTTFTSRQTRWQWAPSADDFKDNRKVGGSNYIVPKTVANKAGIPDEGGDYELRYRSVNELGARASRDTTNAVGAVVGVTGPIGETWDWEMAVNSGFSELNNSRHAGYGNTQIMFNKILQGKVNPLISKPGAVAFDPEIHHVGDQWIRTQVTSAQFTSTGELGQAIGANFTMASGVSSTWEGYQVTVDDVTAAGDLWGGIGETGSGQRNFQSAFTELGADFGMFETQLAGRFDNYSDFGSTVNPKLSMRFQPLKALMFRGSAGTGFRAPSLAELYSTTSYNYPWFTDLVACDTIGGTYCDEQQYRVFSGGNRSLKEERSMSFNIGTVVQPTKTVTLTMDYWTTEVRNAVGLNFNDLMFAERTLGADALRAQGVDVIRQGGTISEVVAPNLNLAKQVSEGLEFTAGTLLRVGPVDVRPRIDHSHLLRREEEVFPGLGFRNKLGERGNPAWKNMASVSMNVFNHGMRVAARTIAGQYKMRHLSDPTFTERIPTYTEYDIHYDYLAKWNGQFSVGVKNILGSTRPLDDSAGFANRFNPQLYDQIGRLAYVGYNQTF